MPSCQAINCTNKIGRNKKSFFRFPDPLVSTANRKLCKLWINCLRNAKLDIETFVESRNKVVCEDHFPKDNFEGIFTSSVAESLNFRPGRKTLIPGAIPTIVNYTPSHTSSPITSGRKSSSDQQRKRQNAQVKDNLKKHKASVLKELATEHKSKASVDGTFGSSSVPLDSVPVNDTCISDQIPMDVTDFDSTPENDLSEMPYTATKLSYMSDVLISPQHIQPATSDISNLSSSMEYSSVQSCGHPCLLCLNGSATKALANDHSYYKKTDSGEKTTVNNCVNETSTPTPNSSDNYKQMCSTPRKKGNSKKILKPLLPIIEAANEIGDLSMELPSRECLQSNDSDSELLELSSLTYRDDSRDNTFHCDSEGSSDSENEIEDNTEASLVSENKYIVFESCIDELLLKLKCAEPNCYSPIDPDDVKKDRTSDPTVLKCSIYCASGHLVHYWMSQPMLGKMPARNLLCSAATLFCGQTHSHISQFAEFLNLKFPSTPTFDRIQRNQLMPVVLDTWQILQSKILSDVRASGRPLRLAGDGRCDSPGYSAKYCTYSLMDIETDAIVTFVVVKVTETGSSCRMEVEGFRRCMNYLLDQGCHISVLATDRHVQIRSAMKKEFTDVNHQFDVWHLSNSIKKKLTQKAKAKGAEELSPWIQSVCNHLWWSASNCNGDGEWLEECWISVVDHVANVHEFEGEKLTSCPHNKLDDQTARKKKWLKKGSHAHNALKQVVLDKRIRKDVRQLSEFCHTGGLEVYHSMMLKYVPKRQEFDEDQMFTRTALAVIDHNMSRKRNQKIDQNGDEIYKLVCSRATKKWVVKPVYEQKSYEWVKVLMEKCVMQKSTNCLPTTEVKKRGNIAPTPKPEKKELVKQLQSRFK